MVDVDPDSTKSSAIQTLAATKGERPEYRAGKLNMDAVDSLLRTSRYRGSMYICRLYAYVGTYSHLTYKYYIGKI